MVLRHGLAWLLPSMKDSGVGVGAESWVELAPTEEQWFLLRSHSCP